MVDRVAVHGQTAHPFNKTETVAFGYLCERLSLNSGSQGPLAIRYMRRHKRRATVSWLKAARPGFGSGQSMKIVAWIDKPIIWGEGLDSKFRR